MDIILFLAFPFILAILGLLAIRFGADTRESGDKVVVFDPAPPPAIDSIPAAARHVIWLESVERTATHGAHAAHHVAAFVTSESPRDLDLMPLSTRHP